MAASASTLSPYVITKKNWKVERNGDITFRIEDTVITKKNWKLSCLPLWASLDGHSNN